MRRAPLLVDTGGWLRALAGREPFASALVEASPAIVPVLVLAEVDWHLRRQRSSMHRLLTEIHAGAYALEGFTVDDARRAREIDAKFSDLRLGVVDASIAAAAERLGVFRVLTIDSDLAAVRVGRGWRRALELAVAL